MASVIQTVFYFGNGSSAVVNKFGFLSSPFKPLNLFFAMATFKKHAQTLY